MRTRRGVCYPKSNIVATTTTTTTTTTLCFDKNRRDDDSFPSRKFRSFDKVGGFDWINNGGGRVETPRRKRAKISSETFVSRDGDVDGPDYFDGLPDDLVICILAKLGSSASCPADLINVLMTCNRLNGLVMNSMVLSKVSPKAFAVKADNWCESAHKFLKLCSDSGNVEASYTLGMIRFYCLRNRGSGASLMAKAAIYSHAQALYSLAVIQFNGSGGTKGDKDLRAGVALCARAAFLGHVDALRELGHCLQDGYGVKQNVAEGRRFLVQANARELAASLTCSAANSSACWLFSTTAAAVANNNNNDNSIGGGGGNGGGVGCPLLSDFGCNVPAPEAHPANKFMADWWAGRLVGPGLRLCSHAGCGRAETRRHEFRRCSVCGAVNYCSRACQALDWKLRHKVECAPMPPRWGVVGQEDVINVEDEVMNGMDVDEGGDS